MESKAIKHIQNEIVMGHIELVSSYVLRFENENSPFLKKKLYIEDFMQKHSSFYVSIDRSDEIRRIATGIMATGIKKHDAYHIACAKLSKCDYFLTTDKRVLKYQDDNLLLLNPLEFMTIYRERRK